MGKMGEVPAFGGRISRVPDNLLMVCMGFFLLIGASLLFSNPASAQNCGPYNISVVHGGSTQLTVTCDPFGLNNPSVTTQPQHGTITVLNINSGLIQYSHNGGADVATTDSFVLAGASAQSILVNVTIGPASTMTISPGALGSMRAGVSFNQSLSASGGVAPYTFSLVSGGVPGINLSGSTLSGTPTERGAHTLVVQATDNVGATAQKSYGATVANPILTTSPLTHTLAVGQPSTASLTTNGGIAPYIYTVNSGTLPPGISLASNGSLTGTPSAAGTYTFDIVARESSTSSDCNCPFFKLDTVTVTVANVAPPVANAVSAVVAYNSSANPITLNLTGGAATSVAVGSQATHGTAIASGTSITYTPTAGYAGPDSFTYTATNAGGTSTPATVSITISPPTLAMSPASGALPAATVGTAYTQTFTPSGGKIPYSYAITAGALPAGLNLNLSNGTLSGTPSTAGPFSFSITATDSSTGTGPFTVTRNYSLTVNPPAPIANPVSATVAYNSSANPITLNITGGVAISVAVGTQGTNGTATASGTSITYTPITGRAGPDSFTYTATNATGTSAPATVTITISPPTLALAPASGALPDATVGAAYSQTFTASGGTAAYSYAVTAGALPAGLNLNLSNGTLSGTPTTAGPFSFSVTATDSSTGSGPFSVTQNYSLTVDPDALILPATTLANGQVGVAYSASINPATGGTAPYTYALTAGGLPAGVSVSSSGGISGTSTAAGTFNFTLTATDSASMTASRSYSLTIAAPTLSMTPPAGTLVLSYGQAYSQAFVASGGTAPYNYSLSAGALPVGISLNSAGTLSGTPTQPGLYTVSIRATDSSTGTGAPFARTQNYVLSVSAPTITVAPATLPNGAAGTPYAATLSATGGAAPYNFSLTSGSLPIGVSFNSAGQFSGTPTASGSFSTTIRATDANGFTAVQVYNWVINAPTIIVAPATLPNGATGTPYAAAVSATGGAAPYSFSLTAGSLPVGVSFTSAGQFSGTPTSSGTFSTTIRATDANGFTGSQAYTWAINTGTVIVSPETLAAGTVAVPYSQTVSASAGIAPYTFAITSGSLPAGITLNPGTGVLSGTPTAQVNANFTVTATDSSTGSGPATGSRSYTLIINAPTITLPPTTLAGGVVGTAYSATLNGASGGTAPYSYAVTTGTLPAGLSLSAAGVISGTPTAIGNVNFTVTATDSSGAPGPYTASQTYSIAVVEAVPIANPVSATVAFNSRDNLITLNITGGAATSVAIASFPANGGFASASGTTITYFAPINSGGPDSFTYTATNASGTSAPATVSITVTPPTMVMTPAAGALPTATVGVPYSQTFAASGGTRPTTYTFPILPAGLTWTGNGSDGIVLSGTPAAAGNINFSITATDFSTGAGSPFTVTQNYSLSIVDAIPVANPVSATVAFNSGSNPITLDITGTATSVAIAAAPSSGTAVASGTSITYQPATGFSGTTSFTYTATNATGTSAPALVTITVNVAPPVAQPQTVAVAFNQAKAFTVTATGAGPLTYSLVTAPSNGTAGVSESGNATYTPNSTFSGTDSLVFAATGPGGANNATVTFNVAAPVAIADLSALSPSSGTLQPGFSSSVTSYTIEVPNTTETMALTPTATAPSATITVQGQTVGSGSSSAAIQLPVGQTRIAVVVTAQDNTTTKTYEVTVRRLPPAPVAASRTVEVLAGQTVHVDLTQGSTGGPFSNARIVGISDSSAGPVSIAASQPAFDMVYASDPNYAGNLLVQYTLSNPYGTSNPATITFIVTARPDPSKDPEVIGLLTAQADSAKRFAANQIQNFNSRLEQLHDEGDRRNNSMAIRLDYAQENGPGEMDEPFRTLMQSNSAPGLSNGAPDFSMHSFAEENRKKQQKQNQPAPDLNLGRLAVWTGGFVNFGDRNDRNLDFDYTTVGVSAGMDYRFSKKFVAGFGFGYGRDASDIGDNGTESRAHAYSAAIYGSYSPVKSVFIDGLIGGSWLDFSSRRYITSTGDFASGDRDGQQIFGSLTASYEHRKDGWLVSPYGRFDFSRSWLNGFTEKSGGAYALKYGDQTVDTLSGILGLRMEYTIPMEWGALKPGARAEYTHDFEGSSQIRLGYADTAGLPYDLNTESSGSDYVTLGLSLDAQLDTDWNANFDYRTTVGADNQNHAFGLRVGKKF
ncbi:putative Ig domain-containing protein [Phyllobacterium meliloti]|uniref:putative Ig domain-containing protein n=1 Tax=Phyllobacterium meliloti TaxID=555317 RepID=UPI001F31D017|nr:putative Ig domain-containing protein [Phyllobacterium sp. T1293]UGX88462.1 putative Ig domain-containing protein [Phyllobacterium sp. T1293]